ncbi:hypothetical protein OIE75_01420 [Streptomyces sp. NBC_01723]|uniref:effector-associated constant component EACC1 n=1 Tax=Streptomyces sp. NBC_01723 TaxID=2975921 RepID=UPI002E30DD94|nr:hypothetical protein [Streptomyces sp. NBC_01723]
MRAAPDDDVQTALDLYAWLRKDPDIRRHAELTLGSSDPTGEAMGATGPPRRTAASQAAN